MQRSRIAAFPWRYCQDVHVQKLQNADGNCSFCGLYERVHSCEHSVLLAEIGYSRGKDSAVGRRFADSLVKD